MQGTFDFEFIGDFFHQFYALRKVTIFPQIGKSPDFVPVHFDFLAQGNSGKDFDAIARRFIISWINENQPRSTNKSSAVTSASADLVFLASIFQSLTGIFFSARNFFTSPTV